MGRFSASALKEFMSAGGTRLIAGDGDLVHRFLLPRAPADIVIAASTFRHQPPLLNPLFRR
jgi:hypothetical protein